MIDFATDFALLMLALRTAKMHNNIRPGYVLSQKRTTFSLLKLRLYGVTNDFSKDKETEEKLKTTMVNLTT